MYKVQLIPNDLRPEELHFQVADSIEQLNAVYGDVFMRIQQRVEAMRTKVTQINDRIRVCQTKVDRLKGRRKATTVQHAHTFPGSKSTANYHCALPIQTVCEQESLRVLQAFVQSTTELESSLAQFDDQIVRAKQAYFGKPYREALGRITRRNDALSLNSVRNRVKSLSTLSRKSRY